MHLSLTRLLHAGNVGFACHATLITVAIAVTVVAVAVAKCVAWRGAAWRDTKSYRGKVRKRVIGIQRVRHWLDYAELSFAHLYSCTMSHRN